LERTRYEASRAERQYMLAEPENRLVVRTLEAAWNEKLQEFEQLQVDYAAHCSQKPWQPSESEREEILKLAESIPKIWNAPTSSYKDKKRIIRILIEDVTVMAEAGNPEFSIGLRYRSGYAETINLIKARKRCDVVRHTDDTIAKVRELSITMDDAEIAAHMNSIGLRTKTGKMFTDDSIQWIRHKHQIQGLFQTSRQGLTVEETAELLDISAGKVYYYINKGTIPAIKKRQGWHWEISLDNAQVVDLKSKFSNSRKNLVTSSITPLITAGASQLNLHI